jgi:hypothetical protein
MDQAAGRNTSINSWLVGLVVLIGLAVPFATFVPVIKCPQATEFTSLGIKGFIHLRRGTGGEDVAQTNCERCGNTGRVTILNRWRMTHDPLPE